MQISEATIGMSIFLSCASQSADISRAAGFGSFSQIYLLWPEYALSSVPSQILWGDAMSL